MRIIDHKPVLFEKSGHNIWTDPYIQQQILKDHLDPQSDGASRKQESVLKIVDFILQHTKPQSHLLDLGCGPGLYTSLLADKDYMVTGIDFNKASIEYAIGKREEINYILGDYINNYPMGKYDAITMIYCDMGTHPDSDRDRLLDNIYFSLTDGGILIFDVFSEGIIDDRQESRDWKYAPCGGFWNESEYLLLSQTFHYPENKVFAYQYNLILEDTAKHFIIWERYYSEEEITSILKKVGFRKITLSIYNGLFSQAEIANIIVRQRNFFKTTCAAAFLRTLATDAQIDVLGITILV